MDWLSFHNPTAFEESEFISSVGGGGWLTAYFGFAVPLYAGALLALLGYNLFLFFAFRSRDYLFYCLYLAGLFVHVASDLPMVTYWVNFMEINGWWYSYVDGVGMLAAMVGLWWFVRSITQFDREQPGKDTALRWIIGLMTVAVFTDLILSTGWEALELVVYTILGCTISALAVLFAAVWNKRGQGDTTSRIILLALAPGIVSLLGMQVALFYDWESNLNYYVSKTVFICGHFLESVLLAIALADRHRRMRRAKETAQALALHYQLNPHFLFNAFNSLRSRIHRDRDEAEALLEGLTQFCRTTLETDPNRHHTLGEEMDLLRNYLAIEQARWEDNLQLEFDVPPQTHPLQIPGFLLLPLVENALKYGAQTSEETIQLRIRTELTRSGQTEIEISNSGRWLEPGTAPRATSARVGLTNLRERLQRFYPLRHSFEIGPSDFGVTARVILNGAPTAI